MYNCMLNCLNKSSICNMWRSKFNQIAQEAANAATAEAFKQALQTKYRIFEPCLTQCVYWYNRCKVGLGC